MAEVNQETAFGPSSVLAGATAAEDGSHVDMTARGPVLVLGQPSEIELVPQQSRRVAPPPPPPTTGGGGANDSSGGGGRKNKKNKKKKKQGNNHGLPENVVSVGGEDVNMVAVAPAPETLSAADNTVPLTTGAAAGGDEMTSVVAKPRRKTKIDDPLSAEEINMQNMNDRTRKRRATEKWQEDVARNSGTIWLRRAYYLFVAVLFLVDLGSDWNLFAAVREIRGNYATALASATGTTDYNCQCVCNNELLCYRQGKGV